MGFVILIERFFSYLSKLVWLEQPLIFIISVHLVALPFFLQIFTARINHCCSRFHSGIAHSSVLIDQDFLKCARSALSRRASSIFHYFPTRFVYLQGKKKLLRLSFILNISDGESRCSISVGAFII